METEKGGGFPSVPMTKRQKALFNFLVQEGAAESSAQNLLPDVPPLAMTLMLEMALSANPSEDDLVDLLAWGNRDLWDDVRPFARRVLEFARTLGSPPA